MILSTNTMPAISNITPGARRQLLFYEVPYPHAASTGQLPSDMLCKHRLPERTGRSPAEKLTGFVRDQRLDKRLQHRRFTFLRHGAHSLWPISRSQSVHNWLRRGVGVVKIAELYRCNRHGASPRS